MNTPIQKYTMGHIEASIWANARDGQKYYNTTISKNYKKDQDWQKTHSFDPKDLPVVASIALQAAAWILKQQET